MDENICRLCLNTINDNDFQPIEDWKDILNELLLNLNLDISNKAVLCYACVSNLQICSNLKKSAVANTEDTKFISLDIKMSKLNSEEANDTNINSVENQNKKICRFCRKSFALWDCMSLNEIKENMIVDMLQKHIPEWNLNYIDELLTCYTCLDSLQSVLNFIMNCSEVEEKINKYIEMRGTNGKGQIELNHVQQFSFNPESNYEASCRIKEEDNDNCEENVIAKTEAEIKSEEIEIVDTELNIKPEELDIVTKEDDCESSMMYIEMRGTNGKGQIELNDVQKFTFKPVSKGEADCRIKEGDDNRGQNVIVETEAKVKSEEIEIVDTDSNMKSEELNIASKDDGSDSFQESPTTIKIDNGSSDISVSKPQRKHKKRVQPHNLTNKNCEEITFKCEKCLYVTNSKYRIKYHGLIHKSPSEITMFKCDMCPYEAKCKTSLKRHKLIHRSPSETTRLKCDLCPYEAKSLKRHKWAHKMPTEIETFKCGLCPYEAKFKDYLARHTLIHKSLLDITKFKCDECPYEAKRKEYVRQHKLLVHKSPSEITKFKCDLCPYEAKHNNTLKRHKLNHKEPTDIIKFKCDLCPYEANYKNYLRRHKLTHRSPSEITKFKCDMCPYEAKYRSSLYHHKVVHKNASDTVIFKCKLCPYETKYQRYLSQHKLTHKNPSYMFQCKFCPYETKYEGFLKRHYSNHKSRLEKTELKYDLPI